MLADYEPGLAIGQDERAVGELVERRFVAELRVCVWSDALRVELRVASAPTWPG